MTEAMIQFGGGGGVLAQAVELPWWGVLLGLLSICGSIIIALVKTVRAADLKSVAYRLKSNEKNQTDRHAVVIAAIGEIKTEMRDIRIEIARLHNTDHEMALEIERIKLRQQAAGAGGGG